MVDQVVGVTIKGIGDFSDVVSNVGNVQKALTKLKLPDKLGDNLNKNISNFMKEYDKYQKKIAEGIHTKGDQNAVSKSLNSMLNSYEKIIKDFNKISEKDFKEVFNLDTGKFKEFRQQLKDIEADIKKIKLDPKALTEPLNKIKELTSAKRLFGNGTGFDKLSDAFKDNNFLKAKEAIEEIDGYLTRFGSKMKPEKLQQFQQAWDPLKAKILSADAGAEELYKDFNRVNQAMANLGGQGSRELREMATDLKNTDEAAKSVVAELKQIHANEFDFNRQAADIDRQIQSYFGLSQMIRKVGDIARDAFSTVKELDKAMTETAVVTNYDVGDMWNMLPTYTAQANQLGSAIKDVYEAATLYYQQGLNTTQAMGLANETLKMARIAGLDAAEATDKMTAALRGFNMEINQMSAQRINDVYSELAAITASDTKEIGSAMQRTASIAHSAGMSFEGTAAFLAQAIETTREPAENIGTAMKTIVARFQEMKKNPLEIGDVEGEEVSFNKVDTALQSIGISLKDTNGQFRELDQVFLDISRKWDSLSQTQQRYIATVAAGSRQQSRFIAMMSDYERTMELVDAANNSAGASQKQFEKTLDSMEAKLNKLKNAWDQFTMGLMNNQILKFGVDILTDAFTVVNKLIDLLGGHLPDPFGGITKSVLTLVTTLGMLNFGKRASRGLIMGGAGWWKGDTSFTGGFSEGWNESGKNGFFSRKGNSEKQGFDNGHRYGLAFNKGVSTTINNKSLMKTIGSSYAQLGKQAIGWDTIQANKASLKLSKSVPVSNLIDQLLPENAITAEATHQLQKAIDEAGGNVRLGVSNYKKQTGKGKFFTDAEAKNLQKQYEQIQQQLQEDKGFGQSTTSVEKFGASITAAGASLQDFGLILQNTPLAPFGAVISTIGTALSTFGSTISWVADTFMIGMGKVVAAEGTAAGATKLLAGGFKELWVSMGPVGWIILGIVALIAAYKGLDAIIESNAEQMEKAADAAAAASDAYDSAKQETSELADAIAKIQETDSAFDGLIAGTAEFNEQLITANEQILALIHKYPMLMEGNYVSTDKNGLMHISDEGIKAVQDYQKQIQAQASAMNLIQSADLKALENQQKAQKLRNDIKTNMSDEERQQQLNEADLLDQRAEAEQKIARINAVQTVLTGKNIKDNQKLASILADQYETRKQSAEASISSNKHDIRQQYADYHGYTYEKSTGKIKDRDGHDVDFDDKIIKDEMIEATVLLDFEANAQSLEDTLNHIDSVFANTITGDFSDGGFISNLLTKNIDTDEDLLREVLNNKEHFQDLVNKLSNDEIATILGINAADITDANIERYKTDIIDKLTQNGQDIADAQVDAYASLGSMLARAQGYTIDELHKTMLINGRNQQINMDEINQYMKQFTAEQVHSLANVGKKLEEAAGPDAMKEYIGYMTDLYAQTNRSKFGNIDLRNREKWYNADGSVSTVSGMSGEFGVNENIGIAFTPYLQTGTGTPKKLTPKEYNQYIDNIVEEAQGNRDKILELDSKRYGIIAAVSENAKEDTDYLRIAETMHDIEELRLGAKEIQTIFDSADLSSAIGQLQTYNKLSQSTNEVTRELGQNLLSLPSSANLVGRAFNEFISGSEWTELSKNIDKIQNSFGKIDAAGVNEAAKSSAQLNTLLETGTVSAGGMAMALQGFVDGKYAIDDVNQTVLELLSSLTRVEDEALKAHDLISNFDAGIDYGEAEDFAKENAKKAKEFWDNGEYGNPQLQSYIKLAAGEERWNKAIQASGGDLEKAEKSLMKYVTTFKDGFEPVIDQMVSGMSVGGKTLKDNIDAFREIDPELAEKFAKINPRIEGENFYFAAAGEKATELTTDEFKTYLEKIYGVSTEYADLIFEYFANVSPDLKQELTKNDFAKTVQSDSFRETHYNAETGQYIFSDAEMEAYTAARGLENVGEAYKELADLLGVSLTDLENAQMDWVDSTGKRWELSGEEANSNILDSYLQKYFNNVDVGSFLSNAAYKDGNTIELSNVIADAVARGANERQGAQIAWETAQQYKGDGEFYYEGQLVKLDDFANFDEFYEHLNELKDTSQWVDIGYAIAQGMEKYEADKKHPEEKETPKETPKEVQKPSESAPKETTQPDKQQTSRDLTWKDRVPGWVVPLVEKIGESAEKRAEVEEAYKNVQGQTADELQQSNKDFFNSLSSFLNTSINEKTGYTTEAESTSTNQASENLTTGSESLSNAASQLTTGLDSLSTAGEGLNTAASNLTNAAAVIATSSPNKATTNNSGTVPGVPQTAQPNQSSVSGAIVVDNSGALASLDAVYQKATETAAEVNKGATFAIKTPGLSNLTKAASSAQKVADSAGSKDISLNTSISGASSESVDKLKKSVKGFNTLGNHTVTLTTNLKGASVSSIENIISAINSFHLKTDHTVNLTTNKITNNKENATGAHNHGYVAPPSFGSAAGGYGKLGPKGKGGLTLTGELGYEIAWLPSENRSMILGANGPQMVDLPGDAVVWTHEQSKKMISQKAIPAGSHFRVSRSGGGTSSGGSTSNSKTITDAAKKVTRAAETAAIKVGKVSVWWENIARTTEGVQRKADKAFTEFEKYAKSLKATLKTTGTDGKGNDYIANMTKVIGKNQAQYNRASAELRSLDNKGRTTIKWKQGKKNKSKKENLGYYIDYDAESDSYVINQDKINAVAKSKKKGGKAKAKAIKEAAEQKINEKQSKRNKAEDEMRKAQEALDKFGQELYETFFAWEIELTKIWNITRQIEQTETKISRLKAYQNLLEAELANGRATPEESSEKMLKNFEATIDEERKNIGLNINSLQQQKSNLQDLLNITDDKQTLANVRERLLNPTKYKLNATEIEGYKEYAKELELSIDAQAMAWKYMKDVKQYSDGTIDFTFDEEAFKKAQTEGNINSTLGKAVQDYVKELTEANKSLSSQYETITTQMVDMNDSLKTLQEEWVGYAEELWKISEEEQKKEVDNLKKLSDSLTNTLKNLLDDVKRKLDQRRQQEDNAKTEQDISRKQQRLAALRADTAGGHQVEIAQLQQEIADAQQSYQRSLEDQLLEGLQQQADLAAEQREQQIALQEATIGAINNAAQVDMWMAALSNPDATDEEIEEIKAAIWEGYKSEDYDKSPKLLQEKERKAFDEMIAKMRINQSEQNYVATTLDKLSEQKAILDKQLEAEDASKTALETIKESVAAIQIPQTTDLSSPGSGKETGGTDKLLADQAAKAAAATKTATNNTIKPAAKAFPYGKASETTGTIQKGDNNKKVYAIQWALKELGYYKHKVGTKFGTHTEAAVKKFQKANKINVDGKVGNQTRKKFKAKGYKTGGLATSTGPAWLDGTPSKPELVLNAKDTKNFVALKDVLSHVMNSTGDTSNTYGDILYEININVDKIEKDYDVDKVVDKVKKEIIKGAGYRNVTQVRNLR